MAALDTTRTIRDLLPNLVIAGASKSGTTSLFRYLGQHPQILPSDVKELRYFPLRRGASRSPSSSTRTTSRPGVASATAWSRCPATSTAALRERLGRAARAVVERDFSLDRTATALVDLFTTTTARRADPGGTP